MAGFDQEKYRKLFLEEAEEIFGIIENLLLKAEKEHNLDEKDLNELFRAAHTLKGGASTVEYLNFTKYMHQFENFLDKLRSGEIKYKSSMSDFLIETYDKLKDILQLEINELLEEDFFTTALTELENSISTYTSQDDEEEAIEQQVESKEDENEEFGVFVKQNEDFGVFSKVEDSEAFGFFDEDLNTQEDNEAFGFFDDITPNEAKQQPTIIIKDVTKQNSQTSPKQVSQGATIRVDLVKIDALMNNIGEQVIGVSMLYQFIDTIEDSKIKTGLIEKFSLLERHIRELQESVIAMRMVPMEEVYSKFPKMIRDTAKKVDKQIDFTHSGDSVEIDKAMVEGLTDPLMHIIRNAIDHGIESVAERTAKGKNGAGSIDINAEQANGQIVITITDDGNGIDIDKVSKKAVDQGIVTTDQLSLMSHDDICSLIFNAGLSTAQEVTDVSGRGVGMDVVRSNIEKLSGTVKIKTEPGIGTKFIIILPLTLAILDGLNVAVGNTKFILPLSVIVESLQPEEHMVKALGDGSEELLILRDEYVPIARLHKIFNIKTDVTNLCDGMLILVKIGGQKLALFMDSFLNQQQVVIKSLDKNFKNVKGIGGATVKGDGSIGLILDVFGILDLYKQQNHHRALA